MKILMLAHFFPPEPCAAAERISSMRDALSSAGHDVTVVTAFPSFPEGHFTTHTRFPFERQQGATGDVVRVWSFLAPFSKGKRLLHWLSCSLSMTGYVLLTRTRFDVVVVSVPPITLALPALAASWLRRARLVVDVRDVFPDIAIAMGVWSKHGFPARACEIAARALYRRAALTIAVTPTALGQIRARGIPDERLFLAPNGARSSGVPSRDGRRGDGFVAVYAGNLGLATDVDLLADTAALLADEAITIELIGDGAERARLEERARAEGIRNLRFRGTMPRDEAMRALASADVALVPLRAGIEESVPTKIYDAVSVAVPAIVAAQGEAQRVAQELQAIHVSAGNAHQMAEAIRKLAALDAQQRRALGERAREALAQREDRAGIMAGVATRVSALG